MPTHQNFAARLMLIAALISLGALYAVSNGVQPANAIVLLITPTPSNDQSGFAKLDEPQPGPYDQAAVEKIDLHDYPVIPQINDYARVIYQEGQRQGKNPSVFSKIGDCMTATPDFLEAFAKGDYNLEQYASLQSVIDKYLGAPARTPEAGLDSFSNPGLAAASGFNVAGVLDAMWSDPKWCGGDETPLTCEFRVSKPSIAFIMFGTNDIKSLTPDQFDYYLRLVIVQTINEGVVPVLSTFPNQPSQVDTSVLFNKITVDIANDYNVPLINLWLAFENLPHQGIDPVETNHMTKPENGKTGSFAEADLQFGYNLRNLITLQTLDTLLGVVETK
jgi:hypothetical protein